MNSAATVKAYRLALGHTQRSLSVFLGVHVVTISKWERGLSNPHPVFFNALKQLAMQGGEV